MKTRNVIISGMLLLFVLPASAGWATEPQKPNNKPAEGTHANWFSSGRLRDNWYVGIGGGIQMLFSDDTNMLKAKNRLTPALSLTLGKWFSPYWGIRMQAQGYALNGYTNIRGNYIGNPLPGMGEAYGNNDPVRNEVTINPDGSYRHYLRYANLHADVQVSLFQLISGFRENRRWDIIPAIGIGYMRVFPYKGTPAANVISTNFSVMGKYRLLQQLDINLEASAAILPDRFDGRISGGKPYEQAAGITLGVTWRLGKNNFKRPVCSYYPELVTARESLTEVEERLEATSAALAEASVAPREVIKEVRVYKPFVLSSIRFRSEKYRIQENEHEPNIANIAAYLKENPEAFLLLEGYADGKTGTTEYNRQLAEKRVHSVANYLMDKYKIGSERIRLKWYGSEEQLYETNNWNRVVNATVVYQ